MPETIPRTRTTATYSKAPRTYFGRQLRAWRTAAGLTQEGLSALAGIHHSQAGLWESGYNHPSKENAERLATVLQLPYEEVWGAIVQSKAERGRRGVSNRNDTALTFRVSAYLPQDVCDWIKSRAARRNTSESNIVGQLVLQDYYRNNPHAKRQPITARAPKQPCEQQ